MAVIFYWSGTGNCFDLAKNTCSALGNCRMENMAQYARAPYEVQDEVVGIIFPVYMLDAPPVVQDFLGKLQAQPAYTFAIATMGSEAGRALFHVQELLAAQGITLSYATAIAMPDNSFINKPELDNAKLTAADKRLELVLTHLAKRREDLSECVEKVFLKHVGTPLGWWIFRNLVGTGTLKLDKQSCIGCGSCAKLCPMRNITMKDGVPEFSDKCEYCLACVHWCPKHAIKNPGFVDSKKRNYTNPNVKIQEMYQSEEDK